MVSQRTSSTGNTSINRTNRIAVRLEHACYVCGSVLSTASATINHLRSIHGVDIPPRMIGRKRPQDYDYDFRGDQKDAELHYACSSCWFHCPQDNDTNAGIQALNDHVLQEHDPIKVDIRNPNRGNSTSSRRNSTSSSRNSTSSRRNSTSSSSTHQPDITDENVNSITSKLEEIISMFKSYAIKSKN